MALLDRADSQLVIVDAQPGFYPPGAAIDRARLTDAIARVAWLAGVATALGIPVTLTEEDASRNGATDPAVLARASGAPVLAKHVFGLADQPDVLGALQVERRQTVVLVGLETDVCVAQSALGLLHAGYRVAVVADATFAPGPMQEHGLARMRDAGVMILYAKGVYYEWVRTLAEARRFEATHPDLAEPPGFAL